jgi:predicted DNA-binding transcriptional regulator YafY
MSRNRRLVRALRLVTLLNRGRYSLEALSDRLGVSVRTVRRDLEALEEAHLPVVKHDRESADDCTRWSLRFGFADTDRIAS